MKRQAIFFTIMVLAMPFSASSQDSWPDPNIPSADHFEAYLQRDLDSYFTAHEGVTVSVSYEPLRNGPTITGIAYPKYYLWVSVQSGGKAIDSGAVRVAAVAGTGFEITDFLSRETILSDPESVGSIFPAALVPAIQDRAGRS